MKSILQNRKSFTLIELLIVLAIVAILSVVVILTLNPSELLKQSRDSTRLSDLSTLNTSLGLFSGDVTGGFLGTSSVVYVSIPDTTSTCANLGLPTLPTGWSYNCVTATSTKLANGRGWIPVNFTQISFGAPLSSLPVDPINTTSSGNYYTYVSGGSYQLSSKFESQKYQPQAALTNSYDPGLYVLGTNTNLAPFVGGLVGWWTFDEAGGTTTTDSSGYGNTGTLNNGPPSWTTGKAGGALSFDGTNGSVDINDNDSLDILYHNFSISAWIKPETKITNNRFIVSKRSGGLSPGYQLALNTNNTIDFTLLNSSTTWALDTLGTVPMSQWSHVVATFEQQKAVSVYINGVLSKSAVPPDMGSLNSTLKLYLGWFASTLYTFNGLLDDIRIYNRALSAAEVQALYNATK